MAAVGIRQELIPPEAIEDRNDDWIHELSQRFQRIVKQARHELAPTAVPMP